jgi:hypothetical protein
VYEGEEATHDDKLTTHLQCLEEQFDRFEPFSEQIGAQVEQFVVMGGTNNRRRTNQIQIMRRRRIRKAICCHWPVPPLPLG